MKSKKHSICCAPLKRTWTAQARHEDGTLVTFEEIVYQHDAVKIDNAVFWRGARVR